MTNKPTAPATGDALRRWLAAPLMRASVAVHLLACLLLLRPSNWPAVMWLIIANHLLLTAVALWPRSALLGLNHTRLSQAAAHAGWVALTIDDGPDPEVTPRVLELLEALHCRTTFFCIGARVAAHPELADEILRLGHEIENHSERHPWNFSLLGPGRMAQEIAAAQASIRAVSGRAPQYFRAPAGLRNPLLEWVLLRQGLQLVSWTRRGFDTVRTDPQRIGADLTRGLRGGDILLLHDGHAARTADGTPVILKVLPQLLAHITRAGLTPVTLREGLGTAASGARASAP